MDDTMEKPIKEDDKPSGPKVLSLLLLGGTGMLLEAYCLTRLWSWFVVPLGVKNLTLPQSYGLLILVAFLRMNGKEHKPQTYASLAAWARREIGSTILYLIMGWLIHHFV